MGSSLGLILKLVVVLGIVAVAIYLGAGLIDLLPV